MNQSMQEILSETRESQDLHPNLREIVDSGFSFEDDYLFLKFFRQKQRLANWSDFYDANAVEAFVNSWHTDDYIHSYHLNQALKFASEINRVWQKETVRHFDFHPELIIAKTEFGVNLKLLKKRNVEYLSSDLESYPQPILVMELMS